GRRAGVIEEPAAEAVGVPVLLPVPAGRLQRGVRVGAAPAGQAGALASLERERLAQLHAQAPAEAGGASVGGGHGRIAPEQQSLRAGPDAVQNSVPAIFREQVAVTVAQEAARAAALREEALVLLLAGGQLQRPD